MGHFIKLVEKVILTYNVNTLGPILCLKLEPVLINVTAVCINHFHNKLKHLQPHVVYTILFKLIDTV